MNATIHTPTQTAQDLTWPRQEIAAEDAGYIMSRLETKYIEWMEIEIGGTIYHVSESHGRLLIHTMKAGQTVIIKPPDEDALIVTTTTTPEG